MAADDSGPDCAECRQSRGLAPVPESGQPLIAPPCLSCKKLQKTFVELPPPNGRPAFNRSISCPVRGPSTLNLFSYPPSDEKFILDHLSERADEDADRPEEKVSETSIAVDNEPSPSQPFCQCNRQNFLKVCVCIFFCLVLGGLIYFAISGHLGRNDHPQGTQRPLHLDPLRNATVIPHAHHHHCSSHSQFTVDTSQLRPADENQTNLVPFTLVSSSDRSVGVASDGRGVVLQETGHYHIDVDFIMDTYSMQTEGKPLYKQTLCVNLEGSPAVCRHLIYPAHTRLTQTVRAQIDAQAGQILSVFVMDLQLMFPDPKGNVLYITRQFC